MRDTKRRPPTAAHNWLAKTTDLATVVRPGSMQTADIHHDDWCDQLNQRGFCNCNPQIVLSEGLLGPTKDTVESGLILYPIAGKPKPE